MTDAGDPRPETADAALVFTVRDTRVLVFVDTPKNDNEEAAP